MISGEHKSYQSDEQPSSVGLSQIRAPQHQQQQQNQQRQMRSVSAVDGALYRQPPRLDYLDPDYFRAATRNPPPRNLRDLFETIAAQGRARQASRAQASDARAISGVSVGISSTVTSSTAEAESLHAVSESSTARTPLMRNADSTGYS